MIGQWVARSRPEYVNGEVAGWTPVTFWHLVESVIEDQPVTRCGRRMALKNSRGGLRFTEVRMSQRCHFCTTRRPT